MTETPNACAVFPRFDAGAVRESARWLGTTSAKLGAASSDLSAMLHGPEWGGRAREHWVAQGTAGSDQLRTAADSFSEASQALQRLASEVEEQKRIYDLAMARYYAGLSAVASATNALTNFAPHGGGQAVASQLSQLKQRADAAQAEADGALAQAWAAVEAAHEAGRRASSVLDAAAARANGLGAFAGFGLGPTPSGAGVPVEGPEWMFLVMLFGSVADNYLAGRAFQTAAMSRLGLRENFTSYMQTIGGRQVRTIPDAMRGGEMYEFKNTLYVYRSSQIRAQLAQASELGQSYTLVVSRNTRVSSTLQAEIRAHPYGGEIVRMQRDGSFTTLDGRAVQKVEDGGWRYRDPDDRDRGDGEGGSSGGGLNHPDGQEADRISVDEYQDLPNQSNMVPVMPWPSFPMPAPMPLPMPVPAPVPVPVIP